MDLDLKQRFYKVYANLPLALRSEVIVVMNEEPISWQVAKLEIDNDTQLAKKILQKLADFDFI